ncbi:SDR family NAD(P)-dependent oxidoreductase [Nocardia nova]|uniref:SDR family NAD(P)-dependent oxidoreductase n=1 Tax=Nocardia nova TaxID=37330 RepID=UPI00379C47BB
MDWDSGNVRLLDRAREWRTPEGRPRRAGVSSFGISGTNAHLILEQAPEPPPAPAVVPEPKTLAAQGITLWALSARSIAALAGQAERLREFVTTGAGATADLARVGWALTRRSAFEHRAVVLGSDRAALVAGLEQLTRPDHTATQEFSEIVTGRAVPGVESVVLVFGGQGSQWAGMGRELLAGSPVFAASMRECEQALAPHVDWSLTKALGDKRLLNRVDVVQPALWAVMVSLARVWQSLGVPVGAVVGHSQGEIAAACVAGVLSIADAARVVAVRSRVLRRLAGSGGMAAVDAPEDAVRRMLLPGIDIAAVNGPQSIVVSGEVRSLETFAAAAEGAGLRVRRLAVDYAGHSPQIDILEAELREALGHIAPRATETAFYSTVTGSRIDAADLDTAYWISNLRRPVLFEQAVGALLADGYRGFLEVSPHPVLAAAVTDTAAVVHDGSVAALASIRRADDRPARLLRSVAEAFVAGIHIDWEAVHSGSEREPVKLPPYAFDHERYWLAPADSRAGLPAIGVPSLTHPLLGAAVEDPGSDTVIMTGRIAVAAQPWLSDHAVLDRILLPGTVFVELAVVAADRVGCAVLRELNIVAPAQIPADDAMTVRVVVGPPDVAADGGRPIRIHLRPEQDDDPAWTLHAEGWADHADPAPPADPAAPDRPSADATPLDVAGTYAALAELGYDYGPAFRGLRRAWRHSSDVFAEVELPETVDESGFVLHPALFDAILHPAIGARRDGDTVAVPFSWRGVTVRAVGARRLRAEVTRDDAEVIAVRAVDDFGRPVLSVDALVTRPLDPSTLRSAPRNADPLLGVRWVPAPTSGAGDIAAAALQVTSAPDGDVVAETHAAVSRMLAALQQWPLDDERRLVVVTQGAIAVPGESVTDLAGAAVWGLVRSAQVERPDRIVLVDTDDREGVRSRIGALAALREPELVVRHGQVFVPRVVRIEPPAEAAPVVSGGTVLITGGTGGVGAAVARHLVAEHGVRRLVLVSRRGPAAAGAAELTADLEAAGATVRVLSCDVAQPDSLDTVLTEIRAEGALAGVVHAAGVLDDGVLESQDTHRIDGVLRPKVDGAWHLHRATLADDLALFVLFSSAAGVLGSAGQTGYAAANRFLDALAGHRRGLGLPAVSVAWGWWAAETGMTGRLGDTDRERIRRAGLTPMPTDRALALFDRAVRATEPVVLAAALDPKRLRAHSDTHLPPVLADLVAPHRDAGPGRADAGLRDRLRGLDDEGRRDLILDLVRTQAATVLGHRGGDAIDPDTSFRDLGFDSLDAVGLRDRLGTVVGLRLPAGAVFDYPTPRDLVRFLVGELTGGTESVAAPPAADSARAADDPVVIVGMSCRFPGGATSPGRLWEMVAEGRDVVAAFPGDRGWDLAALYGAEPDDAGAVRPRQGGFLYDAADFDAAFFGISPREALGMDPQQRLLLEVSWEAVEGAGIDPHLLRGSRTGIFAGVASPQRYGSGGFGIPATAASVVSGRVAYVLGLEGPAITVDTACSSSLVALHLAAGSIRSGECDLALAGGVTVMSSPEVFVEFARQQGLSPDGRCRSYGEHADGTGWAEGVGVVLVERLSRARELGHRVLAVVAGSAVNQDGASNGLTAPNGPSQQRVIRAALAAACLGVEDVDVVEGHGTGTRLGDPIEIDALMATYGQRDPALEPLRLGSVKSNMGHAQAAAGIAGVIKMVMAMRHGIMPRSLHCDLPSTQVDWESGRVRLLAEPREWTVPSGRPRRAAVSSFGISGTNAHIVLEQAPPPVPASPAQPPSPPGSSLSATVPGSVVEPSRSPAVSAPGALAEPSSLPASGAGEATEPVAVPAVWLVSARSRRALAGQAARLREFAVGAGDGIDPARIGWSSTRRSAFEHRAVVVGRDRAELVRGLSAVADPTHGTPVVSGRVDTGGAVWMFPGQGSQRLGVGRELYAAFPGFAAGWDEAVAAVDALLSEALRAAGARSLTDVVWGDDARRLERTTFAQPALFATGVAAARLWQSWGMRPDAVIGHSVGEITAACVAGVLSLPDAARVVAARARLMGELPAGGAMAALNVPEDEAAQAISEIGDAALSLAAVNAPRSVVVSGPEPAVAAVVARMRAAGRSARMLAVSHAFHSPAMTPMLDRFAEEIAGIEPRPARVRVVCAGSGTIIGANEPHAAFDAAYWADHIVRPVRFRDGITGLYRAGMRHFAELGPGRALTAAVTETLDGAGTEADAIGSAWSALSALHDPACAETDALIAAAGRLWSVGRAVDWEQLFPPAARHWVELPTYAFERQRYWLERADGPASGAGGIVHALLDRVLHSPDGRVTMVGRLSTGAQRWLAEHRVAGRLLFPGTGFVELALSAGAAVGAPVLRELTLSAPLPVPDSGAVEVHVVVSAADAANAGAARTLTIHSRPATGGADEEWTLHAEGVVDQRVSSHGTAEWAEVWPPDGAVAMPVEDAYERLAASGYEYGPLFRGMRGAWRRGTELFAEVALPGMPDVSGYGVHPALLDACLHPLLLTGDTVVVPFDWTGVSVAARVAGTLRVRSVRTGDLRVGVQAVDSDGEPVLTIEGVTGRPAPRHAATLPAVSNSLSEVRWRPAASTDGVAPSRNTVWRRLVHDGADAAAAAADVVVLECRAGASGPEVLARAHASTVAVVDWVRTWLSRSASGSRLLVVVPDPDAEPEGAAGLVAASIRGAVRSAQAEHPGRIVLVNSAALEIDPRTVLEAGEAEVALRADAVWVPRLVRVRAGGEPPDLGGGTVLITGGTGGLGAAVARHLVRAHRVGALVLVSRRGAAAPGADDLVRELEDLGARVSVVACDVADAAAVRAVVAGIGPDAPLIGVVHAAGVLDDGVLDSLTAPRIEAVLRPKVDGAWHLHEQIGTRELRFFMLFSSVSGLLGGPGQANYAAANAFLDALARYRRARGLCATAIAWGPWAETGMAAQRTAAPRGPSGAALPTDRALAILDATLSLDTAAVVGCRWDSASFDSAVPAVLTELVRTPRSVGAAERAARPAELRTLLREMTPPQQVGHLLAVIRQQAAVVLGHADSDAIDPRSAFADLGFDSLSAVQFRNALAAATGSTLSAGLVFDHPTPVALAEFLRTTLIGEPDPDDRARAVDEALNRLEALLGAADDGARVGAHIRERILRITATREAPAGPPADADIASVSGAELLSIIDHEL